VNCSGTAWKDASGASRRVARLFMAGPPLKGVRLDEAKAVFSIAETTRSHLSGLQGHLMYG